MINKKGLGPIVATSLLIVVAVIATIGFQGWFSGYQTTLNTQVESQSGSEVMSTGIETMIGSTIFIRNGYDNLIIDTIKIDGKDCNFNESLKNLESGMQHLTLSDCFDNLTTNSPEVVIVTDKGIMSKYIFLKDANVTYIPPVSVNFNPNGNITYQQEHSVQVEITNAKNSLKYLWNIESEGINEEQFIQTFENSETISTPNGFTGSYYLWILSQNLANNSIIQRSNAFNLDNTPPQITLLGENEITITEGSIYSDEGATAWDNIDGNITDNIQVENNVNTSIVGEYNVTYRVSDSAGNQAEEIVRKVYVQSLALAYSNLDTTILNALENYLALNGNALPNNIGETTQVTITHLQNEEYLEIIQDPLNPDIECNGYVLTTKIENNNYKYIPHVKCGDVNTIGDASSDGLIVHYTFNDFQEPTKNIIYNAIFSGNLGSDKPEGWSKTGIGDSFLVESTMFNDVQAWEVNVQSSSGEDDNRASISSPSFEFEANTWYTASIYIELFDYTSGNFPILTVGGDIVEGEKALGISNIENINNVPSYVENKRFEISFKTGSSSTTNVRLGSPHTSSHGKLRISKIQLEEKNYASPFIPDIRQGIVKDYSINSFHSNLQLETTPKWIDNAKVGSGAYDFNGINNYIDTNHLFNFNKEDSFSVSFWINTEDHSHKATAAAGLVGKGHWYDNTWDIFLYNDNRIAFEISGNPTRNGIKRIYSPFLELQKWHHYVATYDKGLMKVFLDGDLVSSSTYTGIGNFNGNRNLKIGTRHTDLSRSFDGKMDDVRIYNRTLTQNEINVLYKKELK